MVQNVRDIVPVSELVTKRKKPNVLKDVDRRQHEMLYQVKGTCN